MDLVGMIAGSLGLWFVAAALGVDLDWEALEDPAGWNQVVVRDTDIGPITVFGRKVGEDDCVQGVVTTDLPWEFLYSAISDVDGALEWGSTGVVESVVLDERDGHVDFFQVMDVPNWTLVADRWWLLRAAALEKQQDGSMRYRWFRLDAKEAYPDVHAGVNTRYPGAVELPSNWGEWVFTPIEEGWRAEYRVCTEIGGSMPKWIARMATRKSLPDNVVDLVREASRRAGR